MQIGPYEILGEIARGGMGVVHRGRDPGSVREVAIKVLLAGVRATPVMRQRFLREAEALARLRHPHVVTVHSAGEHDGSLYLVSELVDGLPLDERLRREGPLPPREAVEIVRKIAGAIEHVHSHGLLHRDLKPSNVLVTAEGEPKLTDFGLALDRDTVDRLSRSGAFVGTPGYWSPEQAVGRSGALGPPTDVFGLGATLYALLTGSAPYPQSSWVELMEATSRRPPRPSSLRPEIDPELDALCLRCLEPAPEDRYDSAESLARALEVYLHAPVRGSQQQRAFLAASLLVIGVAGVVVAYGMGAEPGVRATPTESPQVISVAEPWIEMGTEAIRSFDDEGAIEAFSRAIELDPESGEAYRGRALARILTEPREALHDAERALDLDSDDWRALALRGTARGSLGDLAAGLKDCDRAVELQPSEAFGYYWRAMARDGAGDPLGVVEDCNRVLEIEPDYLNAYNTRGLARLELGNPRAALKDFERLLESRPDHYKALNNSGLCHAKLGDFQAAIACYDRALELEPSHLNALNNRGVAWLGLGEEDRAVECFERVLELKPNHLDALANLGFHHQRHGRADRAIEVYDRVLKADPIHKVTRNNRAILKLHRGDLEGAMTDFSRILERDPNHLDALINLGSCRLKSGNPQGALELIDRALAIDPKNPTAYAVRGDVRVKLADHEAALADYRIAQVYQRTGTTDLWPFLDRAELLSALGRHQDAVDDMTRAIEREPRAAICYLRRAQAYLALESFRPARLDFMKVLGLVTTGRGGDPANGDRLTAEAKRGLAVLKARGH